MNREPDITRIEELAAGHALADLDAIERAEWARLGEAADPELAAELEQIAAELEIAAAIATPAPIPAALASRLVSQARETTIEKGLHVVEADPAPPVRRSGGILSGPWPGWAVAACLAGILAAQWMIQPQPPLQTPSPELAKASLMQNAPDLIRIPFQGAGGDFEVAGGEIVWSDLRQEGYMTLENIPANDPQRAQYQLWIVDPSRDEIPVDGGVFDVPASGSPVVVPVESKLRISKPAAFVITLEQPGGVVRSKQETVVAIAKPETGK